jgi:hypothetical protein
MRCSPRGGSGRLLSSVDCCPRCFCAGESSLDLPSTSTDSGAYGRMKDVIKNQLPKKTDLVVLCPLTKCQIEAYKNCLACPEVQIILTHKDPCECGAVDGYGLPYSKGKCCHEGWTQLIFKYMARSLTTFGNWERIADDFSRQCSSRSQITSPSSTPVRTPSHSSRSPGTDSCTRLE